MGTAVLAVALLLTQPRQLFALQIADDAVACARMTAHFGKTKARNRSAGQQCVQMATAATSSIPST
jgi:hypothetical protein